MINNFFRHSQITSDEMNCFMNKGTLAIQSVQAKARHYFWCSASADCNGVNGKPQR